MNGALPVSFSESKLDYDSFGNDCLQPFTEFIVLANLYF